MRFSHNGHLLKHNINSNKYKFVGYLKQTAEYYFYHSIEQKVFVSKHTTFLEK